MSVFTPIPKKGNVKKFANYHTIALISHATKVMLKILQARRLQYVNPELPNVQAGFRKGRGTRDQIANILSHGKNKIIPEKHLILLIDNPEAFYSVDHSKLQKILENMGIPDNINCVQVKKQQLEPDMDQQTGSKQKKEYIKAVYGHRAYLTFCRVHHAKCQAG